MNQNLTLFIALAGLLMFAPNGTTSGLAGTKHDFSVAGPGPVKAQAGGEMCIYCHTPHRAMVEGPLWNHTLSQATYTPYSSPTLKATVGQPNGSSRLCLSCHDGTVAIGLVHSQSEPLPLRDNVTTLPVGPANLGTDLEGHHPFSFVYDAVLAAGQGQLKNPSSLDSKVRLDEDQRLQCTSCHDPHHDDYGKFLVMDNQSGALCLSCHELPGWTQATHSQQTLLAGQSATETAPLAAAAEPAAQACNICHATHGAGSSFSLMKQAIPEANCFICHNGLISQKNIEAEYRKLSGHSMLAGEGFHHADEDVLNTPRHVTCADCHQPHRSNAAKAIVPNASGAITGVRGVHSGGAVIESITREYELCFRCHGDSFNRGAARVNRVDSQTNTRLEFQPSNRSFHPAVAPGKNTSVPSLIAPLNTSSLIYCTDCHNNDQGPNAGGVGPNGPHGSQFEPLLERALELIDHTPESAATYALCYKCHSRSSLLNEAFSSIHREHVVEQQAACTTCHDPHGSLDKPHLINFNRDYVSPNRDGRLDYVAGKCFLSCHGTDHH